ncbi:MAG: uracil-DNA glycosylase [Chloroflexi bacterium]|nr:uracil-DNA glycosylase [Chloroflexota bacterium]
MSGAKALKTLERQVIECRCCPRLVAWREEVARVKRRAYRGYEYWGKPVPGFGDPNARILAVGLAPGAHGSNRTGRMFTGDASGDFMYASLHRFGLASCPTAVSRDDGLTLKDVFITAVARCVPPQNKPTPEEIRSCQPWLEAELELLTKVQGVVLLGKIALDGLLWLPKFSRVSKKDVLFGHGALYRLTGGLPWLLCSYHPSQQNTQTGKLSAKMFDAIWQTALELLV